MFLKNTQREDMRELIDDIRTSLSVIDKRLTDFSKDVSAYVSTHLAQFIKRTECTKDRIDPVATASAIGAIRSALASASASALVSAAPPPMPANVMVRNGGLVLTEMSPEPTGVARSAVLHDKIAEMRRKRSKGGARGKKQ